MNIKGFKKDGEILKYDYNALENIPSNPGGGSGANLPNVSTRDNGKVLSVVDGNWAAAELPVYSGEYSVTPAVDAQTLFTLNKLMNGNVVIESIPYSEVSNTSDGTTVTIG